MMAISYGAEGPRGEKVFLKLFALALTIGWLLLGGLAQMLNGTVYVYRRTASASRRGAFASSIAATAMSVSLATDSRLFAALEG